MSEFSITERNQVKRRKDRARYDKSTIYQIIDEAMFCHIGFIQDGRPYVIPTLHARREDELLIHGAVASRLLKHIREGNEVSISIAILEALVLAKSVFHHSVNYRSVVLFGKGKLIEEEDKKLEALRHFTEQLIPGQWKYARQPTPAELKATAVVSISIEEASAKIREGSPVDEQGDQDLPIWAGLLPVTQCIGPPVRADYTDENIPLPEHILKKVKNG